MFEWVVNSQLHVFLEDVDYLYPFQSGFKPALSTKTALVAVTDEHYP